MASSKPSFMGSVMTALHLNRSSSYNRVAADEEGQLTLPPYDKEGYADDADETVTLNGPNADADMDREIDSLINGQGRPVKTSRVARRRERCVCFGVRCGLPVKAVAVVLLLAALLSLFRLGGKSSGRSHAVDDAEGLADMPEYSTSLGCMDESTTFVRNGKMEEFNLPIGSFHHDFSFDARGGAPGTVTIAAATPGMAPPGEMRVEVTVRSNDPALLTPVIIEPSTHLDPRFRVNTPYYHGDAPDTDTGSGPAPQCMRYDVTLYVPAELKRLFVASHTVSHVKFADGETHIDWLDRLSVTLYSNKHGNLLLPNHHVQAGALTFEMSGGYMVGEVALRNATKILTQRGDAVTQLRVLAQDVPGETAVLETVTGLARTDLAVVNAHNRALAATHKSSMNGDLYLRYEEAQFNGHASLSARYSTTSGVPGVKGEKNDESDGPPVAQTFDVGSGKRDTVDVTSRGGWVGLYF